jgi:hypothetical protein
LGDPIYKNLSQERIGGVSQVVEHCLASVRPSSNPSNTKKKKKKKEKVKALKCII